MYIEYSVSEYLDLYKCADKIIFVRSSESLVQEGCSPSRNTDPRAH